MSYRVTSPLVLVRVPGVGDNYRVDYHYQGDVVPWLSDEQREHFLAERLVEETDEADDSAEADDGGKPPASAKKEVLITWIAENVAKDDGSDYTVEELNGLTKPQLQEIIDSVE